MWHLLLSTSVFMGDFFIKKNREQTLQPEKDYLNGHVKIMTYHNHGAFLNAGEKYPAAVKWISLALTGFIFLIFILTATTRGNGMLRLGLSMLLGGAFSNTYDRIKKGYVTDYLNFPKAPRFLSTIVFNISDFFILTGAMLSVLGIKSIQKNGNLV